MSGFASSCWSKRGTMLSESSAGSSRARQDRGSLDLVTRVIGKAMAQDDEYELLKCFVQRCSLKEWAELKRTATSARRTPPASRSIAVFCSNAMITLFSGLILLNRTY